MSDLKKKTGSECTGENGLGVLVIFPTYTESIKIFNCYLWT